MPIYCPIMSVALLFSALTQTITGALQGIGKVFVPAISILIGCVCKVILNIVLIRIPSVNIYGAAISSIVCQVVTFLVNFLVLLKHIPFKVTASKYIGKPLIASVIMGGAAIGIYSLITAILNNGYMTNLLATIVAIAVAGIIYIVLLLKLRVMNKDEILLLPKGNKIYELLTKFKIYQ